MAPPQHTPGGRTRRFDGPFPSAIVAASVTVGVLVTLGALALLSMRGVTQRDAERIGTVAVTSVARSVAPETFAAIDATAITDSPAIQRVLDALAEALPEAYWFEAARITRAAADSMTIIADRMTPPGMDIVAPSSRVGRTVAVTGTVADAWNAGRAALVSTESSSIWATGYRVIAPVRADDGTIVGALAVTAAPTHYLDSDADIRQTILAGIAVMLALGALAGIGTYRVESGRRESDAQLVAAKEAAEATARSRGEFLANMSHEIRTPLHGVLGMTEALLAMPHTEADRRSLSVINRSASSLLGILNDILDYSKLEAGRVELVHAPFDPRALVDDVTDLFAVRAEEKSIDLAARESARADAWPVGDASRLRQVLLNLTGNAVKFTEKGSVEVELSTVAIGRKTVVVRIAVRDTGIGISADAQRQVFEQFSQADTSTARRYGGTGLGLTISRQLVLLMGGTISVSSVPGQGSEFVVTLQLPSTQPTTEYPAPLPFAVGERVLVCTALRATMASLKDLCARERLTVEPCSTIEEAQRVLARGERFAAILCDGVDTDDRREHPLSRFPPPLILLTTVHSPLNNSTLSALGAVGQLRRPVRQDHFSALMADLAEGRLKLPVPGTPEPVRKPAPVAVPAIAAEPAATETPADASGPVVLVVDDVELNLLVARAMLKSLDVHVLTAPGGEAALDILNRNRVDLVFMDCHMPGLDGYDVTKCVRGAPGPNRETPIVALSASAFAEDRERAIASGMNDFATKPIELESLRKVMTRWIAPGAPDAPSEPLPVVRA